MAEYIEREKALNLISEIFLKTDPEGEEQLGVISCSKAIRKAPAADVVEVVHGYWINEPPYRAGNGELKKAQECSVCNALFVSDGNTPYSNHPYCCECGAKMDGERRGD